MQSGDPVYRDKAEFNAFQAQLASYEADIENAALAEFRAAKARHPNPKSIAAGDAAHDAYYAYKAKAKETVESFARPGAQKKAVEEWQVRKPFQESLAQWAKQSAKEMREVFSVNLKKALSVWASTTLTGGLGSGFGLTGAATGLAASGGVGYDLFKGLDKLKQERDKQQAYGANLERVAGEVVEGQRNKAAYEKAFIAEAEGAKSAAVRAGTAITLKVPAMEKIESLAQARGEGRI